jgi:hypothetical protein
MASVDNIVGPGNSYVAAPAPGYRPETLDVLFGDRPR